MTDLPPALAILELASLSRAAVVLDAIVKRSPVTLQSAERVSPGKFLIVIAGGVAEVDEGFQAGLDAAEGVLVDSLFLPQAHPQIRSALRDSPRAVAVDSLGTFETYTASAAVSALDAALKATEVDLIGIHLCVGVGGKGYWAVSGPLFAVEEAIAVARRNAPSEVVVTAEVIAAPHPEAVEAYLAPWLLKRG